MKPSALFLTFLVGLFFCEGAITSNSSHNARLPCKTREQLLTELPLPPIFYKLDIPPQLCSVDDVQLDILQLALVNQSRHAQELRRRFLAFPSIDALPSGIKTFKETKLHPMLWNVIEASTVVMEASANNSNVDCDKLHGIIEKYISAYSTLMLTYDNKMELCNNETIEISAEAKMYASSLRKDFRKLNISVHCIIVQGRLIMMYSILECAEPSARAIITVSFFVAMAVIIVITIIWCVAHYYVATRRYELQQRAERAINVDLNEVRPLNANSAPVLRTIAEE